MRVNKIRTSGLLLGFGLGAFLEGILMHPVVGTFYIFVWALTVGGVLTLWSAMRGPGPLPSGRLFMAHALLVLMREEHFIERRSGFDRRSGSPVR